MITPANAVNIVDEANRKAVGHVMWHKQEAIKPEDLLNKPIPEHSTSLFFIRAKDNDPEQSSANIAINDRYQVSLHPGNYTQVYSCAGINRLSGEITGLKTNDLLLATQDYQLEEKGTYFFFIDIDEQGQSSIKQIEEESALEALKDKYYQAHQITRVVPNCPPVMKAPVLEKEVSIELEVLFDTDKAIIKPEFVNEVKEVADFMTLYSNTTAVIEGHTDSRASEPYNQKLSERRAVAVKDMLINRFGIAADRLSAIGYGELRPRATNSTKEGMQLNRRTIAVINERVRIDQDGNQILN